MGWIEQFGHGGDLHTAADAFGLRQADFLDFSANINPLGPPASVMNLLKDNLSALVHYPDPDHRDLRHALSEKWALPPSSILVGNGAAECMSLAILGLQPRKVGVVYPCFSEYEQLATQFGSQVQACEGRPELGLQPDMGDMRRLFEETDMVFLGHPNNPTGLMYQMSELEMFGRWASETDTYVVVDEAFLDFLPPDNQITLLPMLQDYPNVILIRSMTKFYAIPGLRLGYAMAHSKIIRLMKSKQVTWSVNRLALAAGEACLREDGYEARTRRLIEQERAFLSDSIRLHFGWQVWPGQANFLLVRLPHTMESSELQLRLGRKGILIRDCSMYPGLTPQDFRIAVRTREDNQRLLQAMEDVLAEWDDRQDQGVTDREEQV